MNKLYNYIFFVIFSSVKKSGGVDPTFSGVAILTLFEVWFIMMSIIILEFTLINNVLLPNKEYFLVGTFLLLSINSFYFYYNKKYLQIINDPNFILKNRKIKAWHIIGAMFLCYLLLAALAIIRKQLMSV